MITGFLSRRLDDLGGVIGDLLQGLLGEDVRVRTGLFNRCRIVWPVRRQRRVAGLLEEVRPVVPAARQQPEAVDEDDRRRRRRIRALDLLELPLGDRRRGNGRAHLVLLCPLGGRLGDRRRGALRRYRTGVGDLCMEPGSPALDPLASAETPARVASGDLALSPGRALRLQGNRPTRRFGSGDLIPNGMMCRPRRKTPQRRNEHVNPRGNRSIDSLT